MTAVPVTCESAFAFAIFSSSSALLSASTQAIHVPARCASER